MRWYPAVLRAAVQLHHIYYRRAHGLDEPNAQVGSILQIEKTVYRGSSRQFQDGTLLNAGDPIGLLHLDNERVRALHREISHPGLAGVRLRREFVSSLRALARRTASDQNYRHLKVFLTETLLAREHARRLGFEIKPAPDSWVSRLKVLYLELLIAVYHPQGSKRTESLGKQQLVTMIISADALRLRYGKEKSPRNV